MRELHDWCRSILGDPTTDFQICRCAEQLLKCPKVGHVQAWLANPPQSASAYYAHCKARGFLGLPDPAPEPRP